MTNWFINFCAPFIPNDPTINFHRRAQAVLLLSYTLFYATLHIYYTYCASSSEEAQNEGTPTSIQDSPNQIQRKQNWKPKATTAPFPTRKPI